MTDQLDRLKTALADRYAIEREIGSGGMATVYLAQDIKHERQVALKVLRPALAAALGPERFLQEIKIAANLRHPHILPLYDSGEADGFLYYVMPYVDGESLRDRLAREKQLAIDDALQVAREVADALSYAHGHGVVHRDIKPENILLESGHAVVADFGIARAIDAAGGERLTETGVAIGTPAYMSPEQAGGEKELDGRSDLYSLGCVLYEMLAGQPPFTGPTVESLVHQHLSAEPPNVTAIRPSVPGWVVAALERSLAKTPADRFNPVAQFGEALAPRLSAIVVPIAQPAPVPADVGARELATHRTRLATVAGVYALAAAGTLAIIYLLMLLLGLPSWVMPAAGTLLAVGLPFMLLTSDHERRRAEAVATGAGVPAPAGLVRHLTWPKALVTSGVAFAALATGTGAYMAMRALGIGPVGTLVATGVLEERGHLLVAQFESRTADSGLGITVTEALRIDLSQSPVVRVVAANRIARVLARMGRPPDAAVDLELAREIAEREGIPAIVAGDVARLGTGYVLTARVIGAGDGAELVALRETAADEAGVIRALERLSARLRERIGESLRSIRRSEPLARVSTGSLEALRLYSRGVAAQDAADYDRAIQLLEQAVATDTSFAMAYRTLSVVLSNADAAQSRRDEAATRAFDLRDRLPPVERYLAEANYYDEVENDRVKAAAAYRSLLAIDPEYQIALNNLAGVLFEQRQWAEAGQLFQRALAVSDSTVWQNFYGLTAAQFAQGDTAGALATIEAFATKLPDLPVLHSVRAAAAAALVDYPATFAHLDAMRGAGRGAVAFEREWASSTARSYVALGKLAEADRISARRESVDRERGESDQALLQLIAQASWTAQVRGRSETAVALLDSALERYRLADIPMPDRPYDQLIQAYARSGRPDGARRLYNEWETQVPSRLRALDARHLTRGFLALSEGDPGVAVEEFRRYYDEVDCLACVLYPLGQAYDALGDADSALAVWERGLDLPDPLRYSADPLWRAATLIRVGELHEARGEQELAAQRYSELIELWRDADPELQPIVQDMRERIARLVGEPRQ